MEFYFENNEWKQRDSKDGKYWVITKQKTVVEIPDFFETKHVFKPQCECREQRTTFRYEDGLIPSFRITNFASSIYCLHSYYCNLLTGKWVSLYFNNYQFNLLTWTVGMLNKMDEETVERRTRVRNTIEILPKELRSIVCDYVSATNPCKNKKVNK